jgi:hypothetical protein
MVFGGYFSPLQPVRFIFTQSHPQRECQEGNKATCDILDLGMGPLETIPQVTQVMPGPG